MQYYIGGELSGTDNEDVEKLAILAFISKLHEFLMLASLTTTVVTLVRHELTAGMGQSVRSLFVGLQINNLGLLWSPKFLGVLFRKWKASRRRKAMLLSIFIVCALLGISVGICSMTLVIPHMGSWPAGHSSFWINASSESLSTLHLQDSLSLEHCDIDTGDPACPYGDWQLLQQQYHTFWPHLSPMGSMPEHIYVSSPFSLRAMRLNQRASSDDWNTDLGSIWGGHYSLATVPTAPIADGLAEMARLWSRAVATTNHGRLKWRKDVNFVTKAPQSSVYARCKETIINPTQLDHLRLSFPILSAIGFADHNTFDGTVEQFGFQVINDSQTTSKAQSLLAPGLSPSIIWMDDAEALEQTNSTLLAVASFPTTSNGDSSVYTCSIDTRLTNTDVTTTRNEYKLVSGMPPDWVNGTIYSASPKITISAAWARYLDPLIVADKNDTIFSQIASTAGIWNTSFPAQPYNFNIIIESILTTMLANGLARASYNASMLTRLKGSSSPDSNQWDESGWFGGFFGKGDTSIFDISPEDRASATEFNMAAFAVGYAYTYKGSTQQAAIGVMCAYVLLTVTSFVYLLWIGDSSMSGNTQPAIVAMSIDPSPMKAFDDHDGDAGCSIDPAPDAVGETTDAKATGRELQVL